MHFAAAVYINLRRDMCGFTTLLRLSNASMSQPSSLGVTHLLRRPAVGNDVTPLSMHVTRPSLCLVLLSRISLSADVSPTQRRVLRRYWGKQSVCRMYTHANGATFLSASRGCIHYSPPLGGHPACSGIGSSMAGMPTTTNHLAIAGVGFAM